MAEKANKSIAKKDKAYYNELVSVRLFKDNDKYRDDVFVAVNGVGMIVPRGKEVEIPRKYAIALKNSQAQDSFAAEHASMLAKNADAPELN
ncbi:MAG: hypothetical protein II998_02085 [Clostridia bacterium]|nr:hypothetical protein [Clostridia bacterium]